MEYLTPLAVIFDGLHKYTQAGNIFPERVKHGAYVFDEIVRPPADARSFFMLERSKDDRRISPGEHIFRVREDFTFKCP